MAKLFNRAKMTTSTTGTGTVTLGSASVGFQSFADAGVSNSDVVQYVIEEGANFEIGTGTYSSSGTSLTRTPSESSNSDNAISLTGTATVSVTAINSDFNELQHAGVTKVAASATGATVTGTLAATALTGDGSALTGIVSIPSGLIAMWSGTNANIPSGWHLCDGNNSTPDLTERFIIGREASTNTNNSGGSNTVTLAEGNLPSHTHDSGNLAAAAGGDHSHSFSGNTSNTGAHSHSGSTSNTGNHTHSVRKTNSGNGGGLYMHHNLSYNNPNANAGNVNTAGAHSHNFNTSNTGNHSHSFSGNTGNSGNHTHNISGNTGAIGSGSALTTTPVFFTLAFIMKS
ncbi:putative tail fiber protein [uncultured Mediterranean phage uvMED]|nr:putative tail fiber protein [uncultured Mediterranean phage uvMED]BAR19663.1 phage tail fiber-like protein [uncultured Mediterranean phage uvMED]